MDSCGDGDNLDVVAFMKLALEQAKIAFDGLEVPVGCVIVMDGKVISCGRNRTNKTRNATRHAEMEAIDVLLNQWKKLKLSKAEVSEMFSKCYLYVTCEPCIMCAAALSFLGIKEVYYGCANDKFGGCGSILSLHTSCEEAGGKSYKCTGGIMAEEAVSLFRNFYELGNPNGTNSESWSQYEFRILLRNLTDSQFNSYDANRRLGFCSFMKGLVTASCLPTTTTITIAGLQKASVVPAGSRG
ncbi:hypothetical protein M8C21_020599 [Ambrosia artemisiifolia]|uniref:CMP/dCMP-type deaminase domain-containing protein n=1 Tax=Ambrosia artemisiifolia TaxID=4212 RepID=A0AAD5CEK4_AMBAR|nr:hypothetical protein M8C21_020599 [Ambrosia artemisiifolia]